MKVEKIFNNAYQKEKFLYNELLNTVEYRKESPEVILDLLKHNPSRLLDLAINPIYHITDEEFEFIKKYLLKYNVMSALYLYKNYLDKFDENEKEYLLACSLENTNLAVKRLELLIEDDFIGEKPIMNMLVDLILDYNLYVDIFIQLLLIENDNLQKYIFNKVYNEQKVLDFFKLNFKLLPKKSLLFKHIFYKNITDMKFINLMLECDFLTLENDEKIVFHDLYYKLIYSSYIKNSQNKLKEYLLSYNKYIFNDEIIQLIKKYYRRDAFFYAELKGILLFTEYSLDILNSQEISDVLTE